MPNEGTFGVSLSPISVVVWRCLHSRAINVYQECERMVRISVGAICLQSSFWDFCWHCDG
jgi:hypothetical protein